MPRDCCLACGGDVATELVGQLALFRHGGYGATQLTEFRVCLERHCRAVRAVARREIRPPRR